MIAQEVAAAVAALDPSLGTIDVVRKQYFGDDSFAQLGSYDYLDDPNGLFADKGDDAATHAY